LPGLWSADSTSSGVNPAGIVIWLATAAQQYKESTRKVRQTVIWLQLHAVLVQHGAFTGRGHTAAALLPIPPCELGAHTMHASAASIMTLIMGSTTMQNTK
jgi:hypothetical protein